jgi:hypothetical protein
MTSKPESKHCQEGVYGTANINLHTFLTFVLGTKQVGEAVTV